jgi:hypothetical protein
MLEKKSRGASKWASATYDGYELQPEIAVPMMRLALDLIKPKPEQLAECQEEIVNAIVAIWEIPLTTPGPATDKRELREIASALRGAVAALQHHFAVAVIVWDLEEQAGRYVDSEPTEDRVRSLRKELATTADLAEAASERIEVRKGPGVSARWIGKKLVAAFQALRLLRIYGAEPTLSTGGAFFQLAAALYEAATGIAGTDLSRVCRQIFHANPTTFRRC